MVTCPVPAPGGQTVNAHIVLGTDARARCVELLVHLPGHGIVRRRAIEDHSRDLAGAAVAHFSVAHCDLIGSAVQTTSSCPALYPSVMRGLDPRIHLFRKKESC